MTSCGGVASTFAKAAAQAEYDAWENELDSDPIFVGGSLT